MNNLFAHLFKSPLMFAIPSKNDFSIEVVHVHVSQKKVQNVVYLVFAQSIILCSKLFSLMGYSKTL